VPAAAAAAAALGGGGDVNAIVAAALLAHCGWMTLPLGCCRLVDPLWLGAAAAG